MDGMIALIPLHLFYFYQKSLLAQRDHLNFTFLIDLHIPCEIRKNPDNKRSGTFTYRSFESESMGFDVLCSLFQNICLLFRKSDMS
jgi:hypothetical protein